MVEEQEEGRAREATGARSGVIPPVALGAIALVALAAIADQWVRKRAAYATEPAGAAETVAPPSRLTTHACASEPPRAAGTVYYFCDCKAGAAPHCSRGDDGRTPLQAQNPKTPWQTVNKARSIFATMNAGDTVALCRGGAFHYSGGSAYDQWRNDRCRAGKTCDFRDYVPPWGRGTEERPRIQVSDGGHFFYGVHKGGADPRDAVEGYRFLNLALTTAGAHSGYAFNPAHHMAHFTVCNTVIEGFEIGVYQDGLVHHASYLGNRFLDNSGDAILAEAHDLTVDGNYFDNNGHNVTGGDMFHHTIYLGGASSQAARVSNNEIHRSTMSAGSAGTGSCRGSVIVAHGAIDGLVIENNYIDTPAGVGDCWGINLSGGGFPGACYMRHTVIRRNRLVGVGGMSIGVEHCPGCVIEDNVVVGIHGTAIVVPTNSQSCDCRECDVTTRVTVRNNSIYMPGKGDSGIFVGREGEGHLVENNAIYYGGAAGDWACLDLPLTLARYSRVDHNLCYFTTSAGRWERGGRPMGPHDIKIGKGTPLSAIWTKAPGDLTPASGSPLVGNADAGLDCPVGGDPGQPCASPRAIGTTEWSAADAGKVRDAAPDIGAFER